jgi:hypothetical protein
MAITEAYVDTGTSISTTEYSLTNDSTSIATQTTDGVYQAFIDFATMVAGDQYQIKVLEKVYGAGTQRTIYNAIITGVQAGPFVTPSLILMHGWDITVKRLAGSDRSISWSIRQVA